MGDFFIENGFLKKYTGNDGDVVIPDTVTEIGTFAFKDCSSLTSVRIPDSVKVIGDGAFSCCSSLTSVQIPDSVKIIGNGAFRGCSSLISVQIPDSVISIGDGAFSCCSSLTSVQIPNSVTIIRKGVFWFCSSLNFVQIPNRVTIIATKAFYKCAKLREISLPEGIQIEENAFPAKTRITFREKEEPTFTFTISENLIIEDEELDSPLPEYEEAPASTAKNLVVKPASVPSDENFMIKDNVLIAYLGRDEHVKIPTSAWKIASSAFARCDFLLSVDIPYSVTEIHDCAFLMCSNLEEVSISYDAKIGENIFYGCEKFTTLVIRFQGDAYGIFNKSAIDTMFQKL